jgi:hypothetical protein
VNSLQYIAGRQLKWSERVRSDPMRPTHAASVSDNLFVGRLSEPTRDEFLKADGNELSDSGTRPAKMRSFVSSSALAVNFFDPWRGADLSALSAALDVNTNIASLQFEYKTQKYPVGRRSPNLDLAMRNAEGHLIGIESKFAEPFRSSEAALAAAYYPEGVGHWEGAGLQRAQAIALELRPRWRALDAPQLLKHMLGIASETSTAATLVYLWYDSEFDDARRHRDEVAAFEASVHGDRIMFRSMSYQELFSKVAREAEPAPGWYDYMAARYF